MDQLLAFNLGQTVTWGSHNLAQTFPNVATLVSLFLRGALTLSGLILLVLIIVGGLGFIANAGGDPKKLAQSQAVVTNAVIGFLIVFLAYFIIQLIEVITGLNILNPTL
ncbi:hypothetical protein A3K55_01525 [Candidatus Shapirobacteria bacterium RBG_13_44_7]|uniref:Integral membrane protein n=1 Tax=Candidatus Shapirobacteria bacterium RBG_13_44_7 TaxID=1802149 RepID=A0A1F7SGL5_9BACT|nr:MAG: hypothetical protein A3K55_01525 [Candidatus Shapirobacteria bacterium RBG_13_44_7]